jgi:hypothetical protein
MSIEASRGRLAVRPVNADGGERMSDDLDEVRKALAARIESCWHRLMDVVSELHVVHGVPTEEILKRVEETAEQENEDEYGEPAGGGSGAI